MPRFVTVRVYTTVEPILAVDTLAVLVIAGSANPATGVLVGASGGTGVALGVAAGSPGTGVGVAVAGADVANGVAVGVAVGGTGAGVGVAVGGTGVAVAVGVGGSTVGVSARAGAAILVGVLVGRNAIAINRAPTRAVIHERVRACIRSPCEASRRSSPHHNASQMPAAESA